MRVSGGKLPRLFLLLCFLAVVCSVYPQPVASVTPLPSISDKVQSLKANFEKLKRLWQEQQIAFDEAVRISNELRNELAAAQTSLSASLRSLDLSAREVARLTTLLQQLEETLTLLQTSFEEYQNETRRHIITGWLTGAAIGGLVTALLFVIL